MKAPGSKINKTVLFFAIVLTSFSSSANIDAKKDIANIFNLYSKVLMNCSKDLWPGLELKEKNFLLYSPKQKIAKSWESNLGKEYIHDFSNIKELVSLSLFEQITYKNRNYLAANLDKYSSINEVFKTTVHEYFHYSIQNHWEIKDLKKSLMRGTPFPLKAKPRALRHMLYNQLREYVLNSNREHLEKAKFWYKKWKTQFPKEYKNSLTDITEGSATYVETLLEIYSKTSCMSKELNLKKSLIDLLNTTNMMTSLIIGQPKVELSFESYSLGALASFILDIENINDWKRKVEQGSSPLDILLEDKLLNEKSSKMFQPLSSFISSITIKKNQNLETKVTKIIKHWHSDQYIKLALKGDWLSSTFSPMETLILPSIKQQVFILAKEHLFSLPSGGTLKVNKDSMLIRAKKSYCNDESFILLVKKSNLSNHPNFSLSLDDRTQDYYCLQR